MTTATALNSHFQLRPWEKEQWEGGWNMILRSCTRDLRLKERNSKMFYPWFSLSFLVTVVRDVAQHLLIHGLLFSSALWILLHQFRQLSMDCLCKKKTANNHLTDPHKFPLNFIQCWVTILFFRIYRSKSLNLFKYVSSNIFKNYFKRFF